MEERTNNKNQSNGKEVVIVTGSSGLIGSRLVKRLQDKYQVVGLDKVGNPFPPEKAESITFDITNESSIKAALSRIKYAYGNRIASVVHLAAYADFSKQSSPLYEEITVKGTEKLLKGLQDYEVEQFAFSSTNLVYKPTEPGKKIHEDCPLEAHWDYPESKINTEEIVRTKRGNMKAVLLRLAGAYDEDGNSPPITHQIQRIYEKQFTSYFYSGDTSHGDVFVHMEDLLDALVKTVDKRHDLPEEIAINIGEPETPSYQKLQDAIGREIHGKEWKTFEVPEPLAKAGAQGMNMVGESFIKPWMIDRADDHYEMDISRARDLLGWEPQHRLMDSIPAMIQKLKENPQEWYKKNKLEPPSSVKNDRKPERREEQKKEKKKTSS